MNSESKNAVVCVCAANARYALDIAHQRAFPGHCVPENAVLQLAERAGMHRHIGRVREIFSEIA